jgi:hypothetical protein
MLSVHLSDSRFPGASDGAPIDRTKPRAARGYQQERFFDGPAFAPNRRDGRYGMTPPANATTLPVSPANETDELEPLQ